MGTQGVCNVIYYDVQHVPIHNLIIYIIMLSRGMVYLTEI